VSSSQAESASRQSAILLKWLNDEVTLVAASDESPLSMDIIQTWKYAVQIKHDRLIQAIPDTLATLISSVSTRLEFEESGLRLCRALLHPEIVKLLDHGLSSNTEKTANAAACLDLLTQVVAFGGGGCAWRVYAQRDVTLRRLDSYLSNPGSATTTTGTATQIRQYALQYTMANLRYQTKAAKIALLTQHGLARALFHDVHLDSPDIVIQLLEVVKQNVVMDDNVPRSAKGRLLGDYALGMILDLLKPRSLVHNDQTKLAGAAYQFLKLVCTSHRSGVLMQQSGWYPLQQSSSIDSGQAGLTEDLASRLMPRIQYNDKVPVRNTTLASLLQRLRPYANDQERDLAVSIFAAAPELVADYFLRKRHFSLDPRLSSTWIGYTAFILAVIQSPVSESELPSSHESQSPPPVAVALESIIPQPLSKHALTKSINQSKPLVRFVALRLLKASFTKLGRVLAFVHASRPQWMSWSSALVKSFSQRCPELVHVISAYQSCSQEQQFLKEAISSVLTLYYKYTPQLATREVFDVSISLMLLLQSAVLHDASYLAPHMDKVQLMHLLKIASLSSTMRWWHKPGMLFRIHVSRTYDHRCHVSFPVHVVIETLHPRLVEPSRRNGNIITEPGSRAVCASEEDTALSFHGTID
jgi:nucleolar pre-ribosomal-associated protein 1